MGWLNAGDFYLTKSLNLVSEIFRNLYFVNWVTSRYHLTADEERSNF